MPSCSCSRSCCCCCCCWCWWLEEEATSTLHAMPKRNCVMLKEHPLENQSAVECREKRNLPKEWRRSDDPHSRDQAHTHNQSSFEIIWELALLLLSFLMIMTEVLVRECRVQLGRLLSFFEAAMEPPTKTAQLNSRNAAGDAQNCGLPCVHAPILGRIMRLRRLLGECGQWHWQFPTSHHQASLCQIHPLPQRCHVFLGALQQVRVCLRSSDSQ